VNSREEYPSLDTALTYKGEGRFPEDLRASDRRSKHNLRNSAQRKQRTRIDPGTVRKHQIKAACEQLPANNPRRQVACLNQNKTSL